MLEFDITDQLQNAKNVAKLERIGVHSHITGLGVNKENLVPYQVSEGMVGQTDARKAAYIISKIVKEGKLSGQCVLMAGAPGTGKTAIAMGLAKELGLDTPFVSISASEVYSLDVSKTEALTQALRKSIGIRVKEETEVIEGEVVEIIVDRSYEDMSTSAGKLTLKTTDMESVFELGAKMIEVLQKEHIVAGDVVHIIKATGKISKIGRSYSRSQDYDANSASTKFVPCPEGELSKKKEVTHMVSLHEIDVINSRSQGFLALFSGDSGEVNVEVREQIDTKVHEWIQEGKAELQAGVLFIDEIHIMDIECFSFLNRALEDVLAPVVVMATNKGVSRIRGTNYTSPHGLPSDLLDRTMIIQTQPYTEEELKVILNLRCEEEFVTMDNMALELLSRISSETSLRYAIQLIETSQIIATREHSNTITTKHIERVYSLFSDENRSAERLKNSSNDFLYNDEVEEDINSMKFLGGPQV